VEFLLILLQPYVVIFTVIMVVMLALLPRRRTRVRAEAVAEQAPDLAGLTAKLGGSVSGLGQATAWTPRLQHSALQAELTLTFRRGPWHVRVTEAADDSAVREHWIEVATMPVPPRKVRQEFLELSFEDGFVHVVGDGPVRPEELVVVVDMILEALDGTFGVAPRDPSAVV
jgi:hypothetical protein